MAQNRLTTMFHDAGDYDILCRTIASFLRQNSAELDQFRIVVHLQSPAPETVDIIRDRFRRFNIAIATSKKPLCAPCILKRHKVRYGVVIPPGWISMWPLWPFVRELRYILSNTPKLSHIKLINDAELTNELTKSPVIYEYATAHTLIGNGNLNKTIPTLIKDPLKHTKQSLTGKLKSNVFTKEPLP